MIHWYGDKNEESWVNEGFAELAVTLNGYSVGGADWCTWTIRISSSTTWSDINESNSSAHYGGSFLFMNYFLGRFGEDATKALVRLPANGLVGIDEVFSQLKLTDPSGARTLTAEDVMTDFGAALLVQDASIEGGRFGFSKYPDASELGDIATVSACPSDTETEKVSQFGFDYYAIECSGSFTVYFAGLTTQKVLPVEAKDGKYYVWSNRGDESDMTLTRAFDLPAGKPATLEFDLWYDIEENWDYNYLEASTDGGQTLEDPENRKRHGCESAGQQLRLGMDRHHEGLGQRIGGCIRVRGQERASPVRIHHRRRGQRRGPDRRQHPHSGTRLFGGFRKRVGRLGRQGIRAAAECASAELPGSGGPQGIGGFR